MKYLFTTFFLATILSLTNQTSYAQFEADATEYRIVAVKKGGDELQSASNIIKTYNQFKVELPTAFTPNGDGLNDTFGSINNSVSEYKLLIYDRNGALIFESESADRKWDGTHHGNKVQSGSYVYHVTARGPDNAVVNKTGKVLVII